ncbi:uncharacterized protein LOC133722463 [Rosa rugosa]|uniref:uncharacterized protein LOC133722463 n=1 Tax=Rosa rugosa TaxID=74645 RepID=UPI002B4157FA|nr:uncharacterized protein LOC133722463 [Rosa rugosa]
MINCVFINLLFSIVRGLKLNQRARLLHVGSGSGLQISKFWVKMITLGSKFRQIKLDKRERILSIHDWGIGMTSKEEIKNLGTIAKSGTSGATGLYKTSKKKNNFQRGRCVSSDEFKVQEQVDKYSKIWGNDQEHAKKMRSSLIATLLSKPTTNNLVSSMLDLVHKDLWAVLNYY